MDKSKWEYKKLGEVCANKKNIIRAHKFFSSSDEIIYIDISSINNSSHKIEGFTKYIVSEAPSRAQQVVVKDDVLYSLVRPNLKNIAVVDLSNKNLVASSGFCILRGEQIVSKFLYYTLLSNRFTEYILRHIAGANYPATKIEDVMNYGSYIPSISEQRIIVTELDQLNELISLKQQQLKEYDALAQSIFYEMFGDPMVNNKNWKETIISKLYSVTSSKRIFANEYVTEGIPFYRGKEITELSKGEEVSEPLYISEERYKEIKLKYGVPKLGDILLTAVGTIGNLWVVNNNKPFYFKDGNIIWLQSLNKDLNSVYFKFFLTLIMRKMKDSLSNGAAYKALTIQALGKMSILFPPLTLQQSFAERVRAIERQKALVKQSIAEVQTLLDSRMQEYFG
ncbi:MAG: restriction endonuclease subunit S [Prevotella sp.]|nr:restriction endonuclease subunit S [Prevotella sp.]